MNLTEINKLKNEVYGKSNNLEKGMISPNPILPNEIILNIFFKAGNYAQLTRLSKYYNNHMELWKNVCLQENPALFRRFPSLNKFQKQGVVNWKKVGLDLIKMNKAEMGSRDENQKKLLKIQAAILDVDVRPEWLISKEPISVVSS